MVKGRPVRHALASSLALVAAIFAVPGGATAQGRPAVDLSTRWPSLTVGDLAYVRGTRPVPHLETAIGLDIDFMRKPLVVVDEVTGNERAVVETRATAVMLFGVGLIDRLQVTLAIPTVFQRGEGYEAVTGLTEDALPGAAVGDVRFDLQASPLPKPVPIGDDGQLDIGLATGVLFPTGESRSFSRSSTVTGYLDAVAHLRYAIFRAAVQSSIRVRGDQEIASVHWGSQVLVAGGIAFHVFDDRVVFAAEVMSLIGLGDDAAIPVQGLIETRVTLDQIHKTAVVLGFGTGFVDEVGSPEWQIIVGVRTAPGSDIPLASFAGESR